MTFCSIVILTFKHYNKNKDLERYYHFNARPVYIAMMSCYTIVVMALWFHVQYLVRLLTK